MLTFSLLFFSQVQLEVKTTSHGLKHDANESVAIHKKLIGINRKLSLESSVPSCEKFVHKEGSRVPKDQMEVEGADKLLKDKPNKCNQSQEKLCGNRRKLSLGALGQSQNKSDNDIEKVVPNHCPSVEPQNVPVPSSGSFVLLSRNPCKQGLPQSQDDIINMRSKRLCQSGSKQSSGSLDRSEMIKESRNEMIATPQLPRPQLHSGVLSEPLPVAPALDGVKRQPHENMIDGMGNGCIDTSRKKLRLGSKKLSLGFRGSLQTQGKDNKENVVPQMSEFNGSGSKNLGDNAIAQLEVNNSNMLPHSLSVSSCPSKSLPNQHQDFWGDEKQHQDYTDIAGATKKKKAEEPARPESEAVIVLDSEDSEEEKTVPAKTKSVLARKRLGKWRVRT